MSTVHVFEFLTDDAVARPVCVLFGDEPFLRRLAKEHLLHSVFKEDDDSPFVTFEGPSTDWRDVSDELSTMSLFGGDRRLVVVTSADPFVSKNRERLEDYCEHPKKSSVLVLEVESWQKTTRLYKRLTKTGLQVECRAPQRGKSLDAKRLKQWIVDWAQNTHGFRLDKNSAELLLQLVGPEFGLLDQEMAKLALFTTADEPVGPDLVSRVVGGWRTKTIWELMDAAADGDARSALEQLAQLLNAGEHPVALFARMSWSLKRFAAATRAVEATERQGGSVRLQDALIRAGFPHWDPTALKRAEKQLKQLGRGRAGGLYKWLLEADLALKGSHSATPAARRMLELLILRMARKQAA